MTRLRAAVPKGPDLLKYSVDALRTRVQLAIAWAALELLSDITTLTKQERQQVIAHALSWIRDLDDPA